MRAPVKELFQPWLKKNTSRTALPARPATSPPSDTTAPSLSNSTSQYGTVAIDSTILSFPRFFLLFPARLLGSAPYAAVVGGDTPGIAQLLVDQERAGRPSLPAHRVSAS